MAALRFFLVVCALVRIAAPTPFQRRGSRTIGSVASYWNLTSIPPTSVAVPVPSPDSPLVSSTSIQVAPYSSFGTAISSHHGIPIPTGRVSSTPSVTRNSTAPQCTVNVPQASVDWWYAATYGWAVGQLDRTAGNFTEVYRTFVPNTETFDVSSAISSEIAWTENYMYDAEWDVTWTFFDSYTVTPSALTTSILTRTGYKPLPSSASGLIPETDTTLYDVTDIPPASIAVTAGADETVYVVTSTTPVVYFSAYEVESEGLVTAKDGHVTTATLTETFTLAQPYGGEYWIKGIEDLASATGTVPDDFLKQIPQSSCDPGVLYATVTVVVVLDVYYMHIPHANPFIVHIESTARGFEDPEPTDEVQVQDTRKNTAKARTSNIPVTLNVPMIQPTANGFSTTPVIIKPGVLQSSALSAPHNGNNGNSGPGQGGSNVPEPTSRTVGTIGTVPVIIGPSSVVVVGSQTVTPGAPPVTVGGNPISVVPGGTAIVIGTRTSNLPQVFVPPANQPRPPPIITVGLSTFTPNAATQFFIAPGTTLTPGGTAIIDNTLVSLGPSASFIVVGGSTRNLPTAGPIAAPTPTVVVGGSTFAANQDGNFIIGSQTLTPGQQIVVDGSTVSLAPSGQNFVVVNGATTNLNTPPSPTVNVGGSVFTASINSGTTAFVLAPGQTLTPGGVLTISGTTLSMPAAASGSVIVINGATSTLTNPAAEITPPPLTIGNDVITAISGTFVISGQTLTPGGVITVDGSTISLAPDATALVINGQTTFLNPTGPITNAPLLTVGSETFTAVSGTTYMIHGQTLTPGGTIVYDGTTISLAPGATELYITSSGRTSSTALFPATTTRSRSMTTATEASAGATGDDKAPAATSSKGAGYTVQPSGIESMIFSAIVAFLGILFG